MTFYTHYSNLLLNCRINYRRLKVVLSKNEQLLKKYIKVQVQKYFLFFYRNVLSLVGRSRPVTRNISKRVTLAVESNVLSRRELVYFRMSIVLSISKTATAIVDLQHLFANDFLIIFFKQNP